jgi:hypothetical protein
MSKTKNPAAGLLDAVRQIPVSHPESVGRISIGGRVAFTFYKDDGTDASIGEGTVRKITQAGSSAFLLIETDRGVFVTRHAGDVAPATERERVDPVVAEAFGDGHGPLPVRLHPDVPFGPAVEVTWMHGSALLIGIYTTPRNGTVYRWDNGLEQAPTVIDWDLDGPECGCAS